MSQRSIFSILVHQFILLERTEIFVSLPSISLLTNF